MGFVVAINGFEDSMRGDVPFGPIFMYLIFLTLHAITPYGFPKNWHADLILIILELGLFMFLIKLDPNRTANAIFAEKRTREKQAFMDRLKLKQEDAPLADEALLILSQYGLEQIKTKKQLEEALKAYAEKQYWQKMFK